MSELEDLKKAYWEGKLTFMEDQVNTSMYIDALEARVAELEKVAEQAIELGQMSIGIKYPQNIHACDGGHAGASYPELYSYLKAKEEA